MAKLSSLWQGRIQNQGQKSTRHSERRFNLQLDVDEPPSGLIICRMSESPETLSDKATTQFLEHLTAERGASPYTVRNYRQALMEFYRWHQQERQGPPAWKALQRDDFRSYLRYLGRHKMGRAATQLRFSALRSFYKFLIRRGDAETSPIKNLQLPKLGKRLPKFLTAQQMLDLLQAPLKELEMLQKNSESAVVQSEFYRDVAILETIYSCGLRVSELFGLLAQDIDSNGQ